MVATARLVPAAARRHLPGLLKAGGIPLADQGLISFSNFLTMLIMARALSIHDFGIVTLGLTLVFAANTLQGALVVGPLAVLAAGRDEAGERQYKATSAMIQAALAFAFGITAIVASLLVTDPAVSPVLAAMALAIIGWQLQEFARRILYLEDRLTSALLNDLLSYGGQVAIIALLAAVGMLTPVTALLGLGATSVVAGLIGLAMVRPSLTARPSRNDALLSLRHGVWLAAGEVAQFISARLPAFLVAGLVSVAAAGVLGAALLVLNPLNIVVFSIFAVVPMRIARATAEHGPEAGDRLFRRIRLITTPPVVVFCAVAALIADPLLTFLYGPTYAGYGWLVALIALFSIIRFQAGLLIAGLWARRQSRVIFAGSWIGALIGIPAGALAVGLFGLAGGALAMIVSALATIVYWWRGYAAGRTDASADPVG